MAAIDLESLTRPIAADDPCGPDLDLLGDVAYLNFMASAEGLLPSSYFVKHPSGGERPFDRTTVDFKAQFAAAAPLLGRTRDLRQIVILAKFSILDRDLHGFANCIRAIDALLKDHWDSVHPRAEDGDFGLRLVAIEALDAVPSVVMPLQFLPLIEDRRYGVVTYRGWLIAIGEASPREDEEPAQLSSIEKALEETELDGIMEKRQLLNDVQTALDRIGRACQEKADTAARFERLTPVVGRMVALLDSAVSRRDPGQALTRQPPSDTAGVAAAAPTSPGGAVDATRITASADAAAALVAAADYFSRSEPSSPALLLVRQASQLLGKSFLEVMRILVPTHLDRAAVNIGKDQFFELPIEQLGALTTASEEPAEAEHPVGAGFKAETRSEALDLLDQVSRYFRAAEPTSPVPFLIERARDLAQRDFLSVLKAVLPSDTLKHIDEG
jgi:type VI secretion system protein ImpA